MCDPHGVGAISPSSRALAMALAEPFRQHIGPATVLEVGAGTGAITGYLGTVLKEGDVLDVCEIQPEFADILERDVLSRPVFAPAMREGRVRVLRMPVQMLPFENRYDYVISGLPLTVFDLPMVEEVFAVMRRCLKPEGVFSYFEYVGMRRTSRSLAMGKRRQRIRSVSSYLSEMIRRHQFAQRTVLRNLPPAHARHLRLS